MGIVRFLTLVAVTLFGTHVSVAGAQGTLQVSAQLGKTEFFEGEPVYVLLRVANMGPDTMWAMPPELGSRSVLMSLTRDGIEVPELRLWMDYYYPRGWRGAPIAPKEARYEIAVLQSYFGDRDTPVYHRDLTPGQYRLVVRYNPSLAIADGPPFEVATSAPVAFVVRQRAGAEESTYQDVARVRALAWDRRSHRDYLRRLVDLIARRQAADSADSFLPFLLVQGVGTARVLGTPADQSTEDWVSRARIATALRFRDTPGGVLAAFAVLAERDVDVTTLLDALGPSLAGEVIRERVRGKQ